MRFLLALPLLLIAAPALADDPPPHSGIIKERRAPELSDIALFVMAVGGVWMARRALRKRFAKTPENTTED